MQDYVRSVRVLYLPGDAAPWPNASAMDTSAYGQTLKQLVDERLLYTPKNKIGLWTSSWMAATPTTAIGLAPSCASTARCLRLCAWTTVRT